MLSRLLMTDWPHTRVRSTVLTFRLYCSWLIFGLLPFPQHYRTFCPHYAFLSCRSKAKQNRGETFPCRALFVCVCVNMEHRWLGRGLGRRELCEPPEGNKMQVGVSLLLGSSSLFYSISMTTLTYLLIWQMCFRVAALCW